MFVIDLYLYRFAWTKLFGALCLYQAIMSINGIVDSHTVRKCYEKFTPHIDKAQAAHHRRDHERRQVRRVGECGCEVMYQ